MAVGYWTVGHRRGCSVPGVGYRVLLQKCYKMMGRLYLAGSEIDVGVGIMVLVLLRSFYASMVMM